MLRGCFAFVACLFLLCLAVRAEEIRLQDGTKISGKITAVNGDTFQVKTEYGDIQVPRGKIVSIAFPENQAKGDVPAGEKPRRVIDETLDGTTYTNRTEGFRVRVPEGWVLASEMRDQTPDIVAALQSPDQAYFFLVTPERFLGNMDTYKVFIETHYQATFKDYETISESKIQLDGRDGLRLIWHGKNTAAHDAPVKALIYVLPYKDRIVRLSFLTLEPLFDQGLPTFEKIAASYQSMPPSN